MVLGMERGEFFKQTYVVVPAFIVREAQVREGGRRCFQRNSNALEAIQKLRNAERTTAEKHLHEAQWYVFVARQGLSSPVYLQGLAS